MNLAQLSETVGRGPRYVMTLQSRYKLPPSGNYPEGYAVLVQKLVYLQVCSVPQRDIELLLTRERALLELLNVDSLHNGPMWFESLCIPRSGANRLLLSGFDLERPLDAEAVQVGIDFRPAEDHLFSDAEMGADVMRGLQLYAEIVNTVRERLRNEVPLLQAALAWTREADTHR